MTNYNNEKERVAQEKWERAGLANDFVFNKVMLDKEITLETLRRILPNLHIRRIKNISSQQEFISSHNAKGVRLDIYAEDTQNNHFDIEMQIINNHNLPERIRFYHSNLAMNCYEKGQNYIAADNSYVIFLCCFDPFGFGKQQYKIKRLICEHEDYPYNDGEYTYAFDITSLRKEVNPKLQRFFNVIMNRKVVADDNFIVQLKQRITFVKQNREWRREFMQRSLYEMDIENYIEQANQRLKQAEQVEQREKMRGIHNLVQSLGEVGVANNVIKQKLIEHYQLSEEEAAKYLKEKN